jgi:4-amino-4-deoxy-L-arabinose transferase-like glycosyltransferase
MRHRLLLAASLIYLCAANILWIAIDTRPPFWDMANHASWSLEVLRDFEQHGLGALKTLPFVSPGYPPFYYARVAMAYRIAGVSIDTAQLANIPAILLIGLATYGIARSLMKPTAAAIAAVLANFFPFMLWISRETLLETWLTALIALAIWALLKTNEFSNLRWSVLFGVLCGFGMLTKWTFAIFVVPPALWAARRHFGNAVKAGVIAAVLASYWYVPQFSAMVRFWRQVSVAGQNEGDPGFFSIQAWLFYIRALEGSLLFLPLFLAFLAGAFILIRNWRNTFPKWTPIALYLLGGWLGLLLLPNSDPRYAAAALPAVALIIAAAFENVPVAQVVLLVFLVFQHVLVSFGIPWLPERVVLMKGTTGPVPYDWNLYTQTYFGLWGKPERQNWQIERVLQRLTGHGPFAAESGRPVRVGLIPDLPRFDQPAFKFAIDVHQYPVVMNRQFSPEEASLLENDYLLMSMGEQSVFSSPAPHAKEINAYILGHPDKFQVVDMFSLPNGETIRLYRCAR